MSRYYENNNSGYTRGGLDVVTGINLFFKGILIFPILMLAVYIGLAMMKHMLWNGIPHMENSPPAEEISRAVEVPVEPYAPEPVVLPDPYEYESSTSVSNSAYSHGVPAEHYQQETRTEPTQESWITSIEEDPFQ